MANVTWRQRLERIIFKTDTPAGKAFDVALLVAIVGSIFAVVLESVDSIAQVVGYELRALEWVFTILFTIEYLLRLTISRRPIAYAFSFLGLVDLLSILPTYLSLFLPNSQALLVLRALRLLRVFRVLKIYRYFHEVDALVLALKRSRVKVAVFLLTVSTIVLIMGSAMYVIEGAENGFDSIPRSMYWAIVTVTTVGYGDIAPQTVLGQIVAAVAMVMGYSIIIVPTGIFSYELTRLAQSAGAAMRCERCALGPHDEDARFCKFCGDRLTQIPGADTPA